MKRYSKELNSFCTNVGFQNYFIKNVPIEHIQQLKQKNCFILYIQEKNLSICYKKGGFLKHWTIFCYYKYVYIIYQKYLI